MKQCTSISVWFFIRKTRLGKSGETPIMMRISVDGGDTAECPHRTEYAKAYDAGCFSHRI
jgi:hypothetical protein